MTTTDRIMTLEECSQPTHETHHHSRLRNLGMMAQIMLARPIRLLTFESAVRYEELRDESWKTTHVSQLVDDTLITYSSESLYEAIKFCLESECDVELKPFEPGSLSVH
jgi:hypothetical protein